MAAEWDTEEGEAHMVDMWREEPLLYTVTSKGYSNRDKKYAATQKIAERFGTTGRSKP